MAVMSMRHILNQAMSDGLIKEGPPMLTSLTLILVDSDGCVVSGTITHQALEVGIGAADRLWSEMWRRRSDERGKRGI